MKVVCITNDVEATTIQGLSYSDDVATRVKNEALPITLDIYKKYRVKATFFCVAEMVEKEPDIIPMMQVDGHEIGCHGFVHDSDKAYDILSYEEQVNHLQRAKSIIENQTKAPIFSFRAPALRVNEFTIKALKSAGYRYDSSVAPQRLDAFMSLGSKNKLQWIFAPRGVYETSIDNLARKGKSGIKEIAVSAWGAPYIGTFIRICPLLTKILRWILYLETRGNNQKVVTLLFHPNELIERNESLNVIRRTNNPIMHFLTGKLRVWLKRRNYGVKAQQLIKEEIEFWTNKGYEFCTISELMDKLNNGKNA